MRSEALSLRSLVDDLHRAASLFRILCLSADQPECENAVSQSNKHLRRGGEKLLDARELHRQYVPREYP